MRNNLQRGNRHLQSEGSKYNGKNQSKVIQLLHRPCKLPFVFLSFLFLSHTHSYIPTVTNKSMQISQHVWFSDSVWGPHRLIKTLAPPSSQSGEKEEVSATPYITHPSGCKCVCVCGLTELLMWKLGLLKKGENDKRKKRSWVQGCENGPISLSRTPLITTAGVLCEGVPGDGGVDRAEGILGRTC